MLWPHVAFFKYVFSAEGERRNNEMFSGYIRLASGHTPGSIEC